MKIKIEIYGWPPRMGLVFFNTHTGLFSLYQANEKDPRWIGEQLGASFIYRPFRNLVVGYAAQIGVQWINKQLSRFIQYKDDPGQPHHFPGGVVNSFAESKDGTIWMGTARGLYHWQQRTDSFTLVRINKDKEKNLNVIAVMIDKDGLIWCAASGNLSPGLYCYDPKSGKSRFFNNIKKDTNSLSNNYVSILLEDHLGNIWVGTGGGGICRFNRTSQNFTRYPYLENNGFLTHESWRTR